MLRVRPFRSEDAQEIVKWCSDEIGFYKWSAGILGEYPLAPERLMEATSGRISNKRYFPFAAEYDGRTVGFFTMRGAGGSDSELRFGFVILDPEFRGLGFGQEMLTRGISFAFEVYGAEVVSLGVFVNNLSARKCYRSLGFTESGLIEEYEVLGEKWKCIDLEITKEKWYQKWSL